MTKITKEQVLENLEDVKKYVNEAESEVEGIAIKNRWTENIIFQSTKTTLKEAVEEAVENGENLRYANLYKANLHGTDLSEAKLSEANLHYANLSETKLYKANLNGAELMNAKFYGKGGTSKLTKKQLPEFLNALGFQVEN